VIAHAGYSAAFLTLAGCATFGMALFWLAMPETGNLRARTNRGSRTSKN
jgi:predicted MFS family arabinose efflux permease